MADGLRALLAHRPYARFLAGRSFGSLATATQSVVLGWEVYETARETMSVPEASLVVGLIGLAQFLPLAALTLVAGEAADRHDRRILLALCLTAQLLTAAGFALAALFGCARAFAMPTSTALGPMLVPIHLLPRAVATNALAFQVSAVIGPALGGALCTISAAAGYATCACLYAAGTICVLSIRAETRPTVEPHRSRVDQIREGLGYLWENKLVLGAISLDLFAVLLGGATALLPVFARDVLEVGPRGFGVLRAAPAVGALIVAVHLSLRPIHRRVGIKMLLAVALFGLMTVVFAYSQWAPLSVAALAVLGGADMVSVFARQGLVQIGTPDRMRGRVAAVSTLFIGASNELGEFESGVVARFLGPVGSVAFGGAGAMAVTALWAWLFPRLRKADRFA
jgi:MFS family permease